MRPNVCSVDRGARLAGGILLGTLALTGVFTGTVAAVAGIAAVLLLGTGAVRRCLLYYPAHISTCRAQTRR